MLVNSIIATAHGVYLNVNVFHWFSCSVSFLSDVGTKLLIVTRNIRKAITLGIVDFLAFFLLPVPYFVFIVYTRTHIRNFSVCIFTNQCRKSVGSFFQSKRMHGAICETYILYLEKYTRYSFDGYLSRIVCSFAHWIISKQSI